MCENRKLYNPLSSKTVSSFSCNENYINCVAVNFLSSLIISSAFDLGSPISLCLPKTFYFQYLFFDPSAHTLCEVIPCLN